MKNIMDVNETKITKIATAIEELPVGIADVSAFAPPVTLTWLLLLEFAEFPVADFEVISIAAEVVSE